MVQVEANEGQPSLCYQPAEGDRVKHTKTHTLSHFHCGIHLQENRIVAFEIRKEKRKTNIISGFNQRKNICGFVCLQFETKASAVIKLRDTWWHPSFCFSFMVNVMMV